MFQPDAGSDPIAHAGSDALSDSRTDVDAHSRPYGYTHALSDVDAHTEVTSEPAAMRAPDMAGAVREHGGA